MNEMDRWDKLERLGKLHADGLLSADEFDAQKQRLLGGGTPVVEHHARVVPTTALIERPTPAPTRPIWPWLAGLAALIVIIAATTVYYRGSAPKQVASVAPSASPVSPPEPASPDLTYVLRSYLPGASLVPLDQLPTVTAEPLNADDFCTQRFVQTTTPGGRAAAGQGWRIVQEARYHQLDAVLIVRGLALMTSARCRATEANVAFFDGDRLIGMLYPVGTDGISIDHLELVNDHLRIWSSDPSVQGQVNLAGDDLTFDPVTGDDEVCEGRYRVPPVFNMPYSQARRILAGSGWKALPNPQPEEELDGTSRYRNRFPEIAGCGLTGYAPCTFTLVATNGPARLDINTLGEAEDPGVSTYDVSCDGKVKPD